MKIRNGFVSNSSSSSFVIFGSEISYSTINDEMLKNKKIYASSYDRLEDIDFFPVNKKMFDLYMKYGGNLDWYYVDAMVMESGMISKDDIPGSSIQVFAMDISQHRIQDGDIAEFTERYIDLPSKINAEELRDQAEKIEEFQKYLKEEGLEAYIEGGKTRIRKKDED